MQHYSTAADGTWVVYGVSHDVLEPDFYMVQLVRYEALGTQMPETTDLFCTDWPFWMMEQGATLQTPSLSPSTLPG